MLDLYLGFALIGVWMIVTSKNWRVGLLWACAVLVLGNLVTLAFLLQRVGSVTSWRGLFLGSAWSREADTMHGDYRTSRS